MKALSFLHTGTRMTALLNHCYKISIFLFLTFITNIIVGKISTVVFDRQLPLGFSSVYEFLTLFFACTFFVIGILRSEAETN